MHFLYRVLFWACKTLILDDVIENEKNEQNSNFSEKCIECSIFHALSTKCQNTSFNDEITGTQCFKFDNLYSNVHKI